jgi:hypothetical protein
MALEIVNRPYGNFRRRCLMATTCARATDSKKPKHSFDGFPRTMPNASSDYLRAMLDRGADLIRDLLLQSPPNAGGGLRDLLQAIKMGNRFR